MEELLIAGNDALTESIYQTSFNGNKIRVALTALAIKEDEMTPDKMKDFLRGLDVYHVGYPDADSKHLFDQPIDAEDNKVPVYDLGKKEVEEIRFCKLKQLQKDVTRRITARKVVAHGPVWLYAAIAFGMDKEGTTTPIMVSQAIGSYGGDATTESQTIGYVDGKIHNMCALIVRRAKLQEMNLKSICVGYRYIFVEPEDVGKAGVKEG